MRTLLAISSLLLLADVSVCHGQPRTGKFRGLRVETKPATHEQLVENAERAFIGTVESVETVEEERSVEIDGEEKTTSVRLRVVTFHVEQIIFDRAPELRSDESLTEGELFVVRSHAATSRLVEPGEKLFWFLSPPSKYGLSQPVGIDSGHFRIVTDESMDTLSVVNLKHNRNLVDPMGIGAAEAEEIAETVPADKRQELKAHLAMWLRNADAGGVADPIPLDVLVGRTKLLVQTRKFQPEL